MLQRSVFSNVADLERAKGERAGESTWRTITQELIDDFARVTGDHQWIHVDAERARRDSPLGTTIAHGFLTLSLLPSMIEECVRFENVRMSFNYGFDRVRFTAPVPVNAAIRGVFSIEELRAIPGGGVDVVWRVEVEVRDAAKPALIATWVTRLMFRTVAHPSTSSG